ncbi:hypothetical protein ACSBR2_017593 [Camellia fascicularis]
MPLLLGVGLKKANVVSASGILEYTYKDLLKATCNFTTMIGQGAFGPVYKAQMLTGETVAVKVLATDSKQGAKEFQTEWLSLNEVTQSCMGDFCNAFPWNPKSLRTRHKSYNVASFFSTHLKGKLLCLDIDFVERIEKKRESNYSL